MPKEVRPEETKLFLCEVCRQVILYRLPRRLKGFFVHMRCRFGIDEVLQAEVIDE